MLSRGAWDRNLSADDIRQVTSEFFAWFERLRDEGKMKSGRQLADEGKILSGRKAITDGPFGESKEVIGGYWFIQAESLEEAVEIAAGNPCLDCGVTIEIRPVIRDDPEV